MRIRSITIGANVSYPPEESFFRACEEFQKRARALFADSGLEVQTVRLATQPFPEVLREAGPGEAVPLAQKLEKLCQAHSIDYCSIGTVVAAPPVTDLAYIDAIPAIIQHTETVFASALMSHRGAGINLAAIARAAAAINTVAHSTPQGFGNLRFAVLANCEAGSPFFPAAFHRGPGPAFSIATEAADLAVDAFARATTLEEAHENLKTSVEAAARTIAAICYQLEEDHAFRFGGIDFSLAPYPETARSIGHAIEKLGIDVFGGHATLFAVAFITRILRQAQFPRCGFSGLLLPVLEDRTIAQRSTEDLLTLDGLLLYSAVCGTGLDTIPLPGEVSVEELAAILLDVATLAQIADKPLTARLMPIPGKKAEDVTTFDFAYFANARLLKTRGYGASKIFEHNPFVNL